ncbi:hypothetical protein IFM89_037871, partial [Coptis chinensis]
TCSPFVHFSKLFRTQAVLKKDHFYTTTTTTTAHDSSQKLRKNIHQHSLRVLEWDKVCNCVASFAGTTLGQQATKTQLWELNPSYEESKTLLSETNAAVEMLKHGGCALEFSGIDVVLVKSAIQHASRGLPVEGKEAFAVVAILQLSETLQLNVKAACKQDSDWYNRFMPLTKMILDLFISPPLVKSIQQVIDDDGLVKDSASSDLQRSRDQVRMLERKLFQLMNSLVMKESSKSSSLEVSKIDGRWCLRTGFDQVSTVKGLLLSSVSGEGSLVEPLPAVSLNNELQQARGLVAKAEEDVLLRITEKMRKDLEEICDLLNTVIQLDMVIARAKYSVSFGGTFPDLLLTKDKDGYFGVEYHTSGTKTSNDDLTQKEWILYLPNAYHPLLLQQHQQSLKKARKNVTNAIADIRRRKLQPENNSLKEEPDVNIEYLEMEVAKLEKAHPIPVDFFVDTKTRVLIITGPNTGGKTICLKTIGLAAMMAKSGLYVLSSEPVRIPWFDSIFSDIGDEQSLSHSLSTFSGHLRQIGAIQALSTCQSLVLLDEVGGGTNPLEGAALGMSILESFAEGGALLTIATTHHGELKTLKYSSTGVENACMEFDDINLKPTYKILWGVPGRSNAINIAERLGLPNTVLDNARELYGTASAEINEDGIPGSTYQNSLSTEVNQSEECRSWFLTLVIIEMEQFKQDLQKHVQEADHYLILSRELHENLLVANEKITEHRITQRYRMMKEVSEATVITTRQKNLVDNKQKITAKEAHQEVSNDSHLYAEYAKKSPSENRITLPKVGDMVHVLSLGKKATVLKVEPSKEEVVVQASNMKLRLKLSDLQT